MLQLGWWHSLQWLINPWKMCCWVGQLQWMKARTMLCCCHKLILPLHLQTLAGVVMMTDSCQDMKSVLVTSKQMRFYNKQEDMWKEITCSQNKKISIQKLVKKKWGCVSARNCETGNGRKLVPDKCSDLPHANTQCKVAWHWDSPWCWLHKLTLCKVVLHRDSSWGGFISWHCAGSAKLFCIATVPEAGLISWHCAGWHYSKAIQGQLLSSATTKQKKSHPRNNTHCTRNTAVKESQPFQLWNWLWHLNIRHLDIAHQMLLQLASIIVQLVWC